MSVGEAGWRLGITRRQYIALEDRTALHRHDQLGVDLQVLRVVAPTIDGRRSANPRPVPDGARYGKVVLISPRVRSPGNADS